MPVITSPWQMVMVSERYTTVCFQCVLLLLRNCVEMSAMGIVDKRIKFALAAQIEMTPSCPAILVHWEISLGRLCIGPRRLQSQVLTLGLWRTTLAYGRL